MKSENQNWRERLVERQRKLDEDWQRYLELLEKVKRQEPFSEQDREYMRMRSPNRQKPITPNVKGKE